MLESMRDEIERISENICGRQRGANSAVSSPRPGGERAAKLVSISD
jgi:hypothetical protein